MSAELRTTNLVPGELGVLGPERIASSAEIVEHCELQLVRCSILS